MSNPKPTQAEIDAEIKALEDVLPKVPARSFFGDDNRSAIRVSMRVLKDNMSEDDIYDRYGDSADNVLEEALGARHWLDGDYDGEFGSPSKEWEQLIK